MKLHSQLLIQGWKPNCFCVVCTNKCVAELLHFLSRNFKVSGDCLNITHSVVVFGNMRECSCLHCWCHCVHIVVLLVWHFSDVFSNRLADSESGSGWTTGAATLMKTPPRLVSGAADGRCDQVCGAAIRCAGAAERVTRPAEGGNPGLLQTKACRGVVVARTRTCG